MRAGLEAAVGIALVVMARGEIDVPGEAGVVIQRVTAPVPVGAGVGKIVQIDGRLGMAALGDNGKSPGAAVVLAVFAMQAEQLLARGCAPTLAQATLFICVGFGRQDAGGLAPGARQGVDRPGQPGFHILTAGPLAGCAAFGWQAGAAAFAGSFAIHADTGEFRFGGVGGG